MARARGFTLLEMVIVLLLMGVAMAIVLSIAGKGASAADLKASARSIAAGLRSAQSMAMSTRRDATLTLDVDAREFSYSGGSKPLRLPDGVELKLFTAQNEVESGRKGSIRFYPDGSSTGGRVTVSAGERQYMVDVDWLTGRVTVTE